MSYLGKNSIPFVHIPTTLIKGFPSYLVFAKLSGEASYPSISRRFPTQFPLGFANTLFGAVERHDRSLAVMQRDLHLARPLPTRGRLLQVLESSSDSQNPEKPSSRGLDFNTITAKVTYVGVYCV